MKRGLLSRLLIDMALARYPINSTVVQVSIPDQVRGNHQTKSALRKSYLQETAKIITHQNQARW